MEIYLIRHTTPDVAPGTCYGRLDLPLVPAFAEEAEAVLRELPKDLAAVYSSPLSRCTRLAEKIAPDFRVDSRLLELDFGRWEGQKWEALPFAELQPWMDNYYQQPTPAGDSMQQMAQRVQNFREALQNKGESPLAIVAHGGPLKLWLGQAQGLPVEEWMSQQVACGQVIRQLEEG